MSNKFETDINLNDNKSFDVNKFVGKTETKARRIMLNYKVNEEEERKFKKLAEVECGGNQQALFRKLILPALDKLV